MKSLGLLLPACAALWALSGCCMTECCRIDGGDCCGGAQVTCDDCCQGCGQAGCGSRTGRSGVLAGRSACGCEQPGCDGGCSAARTGLLAGRGGSCGCGQAACDGGCGCQASRGGLLSGRGGSCGCGQGACDGRCGAGGGLALGGRPVWREGNCGCGDCALAGCNDDLGRGGFAAAPIGGAMNGLFGGGMGAQGYTAEYGCGYNGCGHNGRLCGRCQARLGRRGLRGGIPHTPMSDLYGQGPVTPTYAYPYYTTRGPRDFLMDNPPSIGY